MSGSPAGLALQFAWLLIELLVLLVVVAGALGLVARRAGMARLHRWLGGARLTGAGKGALLGFVTPFCTYSAVPVFVAMVDAGVRTATVAGFVLAAPLLDPVVVAVLWLLFGWQPTLAYAAVTLAAVLVLAVAADAAGAARALRPAAARVLAGGGRAGEERPDCGLDPFADDRPWRGLRVEAPDAGRYALSVARGLALPLLVAVAVAAAIVGLVPETLVARLAGPDNPLAVPVAAVLGAPFYVSTEAFLPIASGLHQAGMGLGAVFALTVSAAGVNVPELALLSRLMAPRLLAAYVAAVVGMAVAAGLLVPALS